jgi:sterol desaturase/sphingolipid hydroxylase (fatty acid hydroxylase superfamily)
MLSLSILGAGLSFLFLVVLFGPLEKLFPAKGQPFLRPNWWTDLAFFLGQYLVWGGGVLALLTLVRRWLDGAVPSGFRDVASSQPWWLQAIEVILLSDLFVYWGHRLQHRIGFLWRFHSIHHSAEHLDWLAAHREHPLDTIYTIGLINLPAFLMGFRLETIAGLLAFRGLWAIYIHSNVRLPIGPLRMLLGAPELHHWHHSRERDAGNYANISPLMDLLFGTYRCPNQEPPAFGLNEPLPQNYLAQLIHPFRPKNSLTDRNHRQDVPLSRNDSIQSTDGHGWTQIKGSKQLVCPREGSHEMVNTGSTASSEACLGKSVFIRVHLWLSSAWFRLSSQAKDRQLLRPVSAQDQDPLDVARTAGTRDQGNEARIIRRIFLFEKRERPRQISQ